MAGPVRRFPLRGLALIALGFFIATLLAGGGGAAGTAAGIGFGLLFLPLLALKLLFMFFLVGAFFRFAGGGWGRGGPWNQGRRGYRPHYHRHRYGYPAGEPVPDPEAQEWEEHLRQARAEVDDLDTPFDPETDFRPPKPSSE